MVSLGNVSFKEVLDDLSVRFIVNLPEEELGSVARICFQIEQAHWYYEDFIRELNPRLPSMHLRTFCLILFAHCPLLWKWNKEQEKAYNDFLKYKIRVPVRGAILLNNTYDKCILVKGWKNSSGWGFPKGKINKNELDTDCAIREVFEETGFDISKLLQPKDYIEITLCEQNIRLYIIENVPSDTNFTAQTRKEISEIKWHKLSDLPTYSRSRKKHENKEVSKCKYYLVAPFLEPLIEWIKKKYKSYSDPVETTKEFIDSDVEADQNVHKKNSETLKALLGISSYSPISKTSFSTPFNSTYSFKEKKLYMNENISDNDQKYNVEYHKNNMPNDTDKDLEEKDKGAEKIMELLLSNINHNNMNKICENNDVISYEKESNISFFNNESRENKICPPSPPKILPLNFSTNAKRFNQTSNVLEEENLASNYSDANNCNKKTLFSALFGQKMHDLGTNLQENNLDIKNDKIKMTEQTNTDKQLGTLSKPKGLENHEDVLSLETLPTLLPPFVINTNGTAIEKLDAQLLRYLESVVMKSKVQN